MSVQEIEAAITRLQAQEFAELMSWLDEYAAQRWDNQIENDLDSGRLDDLLAEVDREHEAGASRRL